MIHGSQNMWPQNVDRISLNAYISKHIEHLVTACPHNSLFLNDFSAVRMRSNSLSPLTGAGAKTLAEFKLSVIIKMIFFQFIFIKFEKDNILSMIFDNNLTRNSFTWTSKMSARCIRSFDMEMMVPVDKSSGFCSESIVSSFDEEGVKPLLSSIESFVILNSRY